MKHLIAIAIFLISNVVYAQIPNLQQNTLNFKDITSTNLVQTVIENAGLNEKDFEFADYDNDGDLDCVMSVGRGAFGQRFNKLYRNDNGILIEVSGDPVIPGFGFNDTARAAFFRDFDLDGFADIVVVCDSNSGTATNNSPGKTKYFRNVGGTHFINESERLGGITGSAANGTVADFDSNGLPDLIMINEPSISQDSLALNGVNGSPPGQLVVVTQTNYPQESQYGDNGEAADMNGDGQIDLLVANSASMPSFIYYNNNLSRGESTGDFRYEFEGSESSFNGSGGGLDERSLFPGDFDNDGRMDFYFADRVFEDGLNKDFVMQNVGNDEFNRAMFVPVPMPDSTGTETMKIRSSDLDLDGRIDLLVMSEFRRPQIFRNTSENGEISFLEWTPPVFQPFHSGWQANSADLNGDSRKEILVGAMLNDFLFSNEASQLFNLDDLQNKQIPAFHAGEPISIAGEIEFGQSIVLSTESIPAGSSLSVLARSFGDIKLTISQHGSTLAELDRPGHASDEAVQIHVSKDGPIAIEITMNAISFDGNEDGVVNLLDVADFVDCLNGSSSNCDAFDLDDDGNIELLLVQPFVDSVMQSRTNDQFVLEILSRND